MGSVKHRPFTPGHVGSLPRDVKILCESIILALKVRSEVIKIARGFTVALNIRGIRAVHTERVSIARSLGEILSTCTHC